MSADNFYDVWCVEGRWYVSQGFASSEEVSFPYPGNEPVSSKEEAERLAETQYSEYGWSSHEGDHTWEEIAEMAAEEARRNVMSYYEDRLEDVRGRTYFD